MKGPYPPGTWTGHTPTSQWDWERGRLERGRAYRVTREFVDAEGDRHQAGEEWTFVMSLYSQFDDELTLCLRSASNEEWSFSLLRRPGGQTELIDSFSDYVAPIA